MDFLRKLDLTVPQLLKAGAIIVVGLILLILVSSLFGQNFSPFSPNSIRDKSISSAPSMGMPDLQFYDDAVEETTLSVRNVTGGLMPIPPEDGGGFTPGADGEAFEVKEYHGSIETGDGARDCALIRELKTRDGVIFEHANEHERGCMFTFKVENGYVEEVLKVIEELGPKELTERSFTIKRQVDDYTSEIEILEAKLKTINATLESAEAQYNDITALATRIQDVESLAKIINSKLSIIERLTEEKLRTSSQLERIARQKAEQLDRLSYTYFYISVYENKYIDRETLKDSWKRASQQFVYEVNQLAQDLSVGLVALLLVILKYLIYFLIILFVVKYLWMFTRSIWRSGKKRGESNHVEDIHN